MSDTYEVELLGCTPQPLMSYLKALGTFRVVAEQVHSGATACWGNDNFVLISSLNQKALVRFLEEDYKPTPILGAWAGGSGFFGNDNREAVDGIAESEVSRAEGYRKCIACARHILKDEGVKDKPANESKSILLQRYRREMPDEFVRWMDAAIVLQSNGQTFAPLLGTGGNDGRLDFTQNFMKRLMELKLFDEQPSEQSTPLLKHALFGITVRGLSKASVGQFSPGRAGGPNATQGMEGSSTDNPWDYILMLEGALLLAGSVVRRLGLASRDKPVFPFTVRSRAVGEGSPTEEELGASRGELWLPLWTQQAGLSELSLLFSEGRADCRGRPAHDAVEFARAIAELSVDRGIKAFERYGFLKRSGKAYLATAMNRFHVPENPRDATHLLGQVDPWLDAFNRACAAKETPSRIKSACTRIQSKMFQYYRYGRREDLQSLLVALGVAEQSLAITGGQRGGKEICRPIAQLSPQWLAVTHDDSLEYHVALALASMYDRENRVCSFRSNVEPVAFENGRWAWRNGTPRVVWGSAGLPRNMAAVLSRRMMDWARLRCIGLPLDSRWALPSDAIAAFISGEVDDRRIEQLLWGLLLIDHRHPYPQGLPQATAECAPPMPRDYAILKLLFFPRPLVREWQEGRARWRQAREHEEGIRVRPEPRVLPLLRAGRVADACRVAYQRLQSSGLTPMPGPGASGVWRERDWEPDLSVDPQRLCAALLLPVSDVTLNHLVNLVTRQENGIEPETSIHQGEI